MVIATEELKFLDIIYYIATGYNYNSFIKAYGAEKTKGYFPYEWLITVTSIPQLSRLIL